MTTTIWFPNAANIAQVDSLTVSGVAVGGTISATINTKSITYTMVAGDTNATSATNLLALLQATTVPPEFAEITWSISPSNSAQILATCTTPGLPFTLTSSATGGPALTHANVTANVSQSDVGNASNWLRGGSPGIPQNTDDVVVADSSVGMLYNLTALAAVQFNSYTRKQSMTGPIGLNEINPSGYQEYRPINFQFTCTGTINVILGTGSVGNGPTRERYDFQSGSMNVNVQGSGSTSDPYQVMLLGSAIATLNIVNTSVGVATLPGAVSTVTTVVVGSGGSLKYGTGVTASGTVTVTGGTFQTEAVVGTINAYAGSQILVQSKAGTTANLIGQDGAQITWNSNTAVTDLTLANGCVLDKSGDPRAMTITIGTIDGTCRILDPLSTITYTNPITVLNAVSSGPFTFGNRTVKIV